MLTATGAFLIGAAAIVVLLAVLEVVARVSRYKKSLLGVVLLGEDGRTSTSKTFVFMWTLLVGWALVSLLVAGELVNLHACVGAKATLRSCPHLADSVGLLQIGWQNFLTHGLDGNYLVLLGIPAGSAVAAKGITQAKTNAGTLVKTRSEATQAGTGALSRSAARVTEVFSADDGTTDVGDLQYVLFNLILAAFFVARFIQPDPNGLPALPATLLGLTSVSAALYVGKKAATRNQPTITGVFPSLLRPGSQFTITGTDLTVTGAVAAPAVSVNGVVVNGTAAADTITAQVPRDILAAGAGRVEARVQVRTRADTLSNEFVLQLQA